MNSSGARDLLAQLWVGLVFVVLGAFTVTTNHDFPSGDLRGQPWFWFALGVATIVVGVALLIHLFRRVANRERR